MIGLSARLMIVNQLLILLSELSSKIRKERGELLVKVIIDADDFGMSEAINHGIIKSYVDGLTTSTLLMPNYQQQNTPLR